MDPGGENIDNLGELMVKVLTEQHDGTDISSRVTFQRAKVRKPLLAVDKGNFLVFYESRFARKAITMGSRTRPLVCLAELGA